MQENIEKILQTMENIAVVGLSPDETKASFIVSKFLQTQGYKIYPIYPKAEEILGEKVYRSLKDINTTIDLVLMFRKAEFAEELFEQLLQKGIKNFWLQSGIENEIIKQKSKENNINFVQNRCIMIEFQKFFNKEKNVRT